MKKITLALIILLGAFSLAMADWLVTFQDDYEDSGIDTAVDNAINKGDAAVDSVLLSSLELDDGKLLHQNIIKALYCAGVKGDVIKAAADELNELNADNPDYEPVTPLAIVGGFKKSKEQCGDRVVDSQAYTPSFGGFNGSTLSSSTSQNSVSQATFPN